jgi:putative tryptophan/tyrosine transport system substrate-binding protein
VRRREFILALGATAAWPLAARAQVPATRSRVPVLGYLSSGPAGARQETLGAFRRALQDAGYIEGQTLLVQYRWADDQYDRLPMLAADLVSSRVDIIAATGGPLTALAAKNATSSIPIVFTAVSDPLQFGLIASYNRPAGNITGSGGLVAELDAKRLGLMLELLPGARKLGVLINPNRPGVDSQLDDLTKAAHTAGRQVIVLRAGNERELDDLSVRFSADPIDALVIAADPFFNSRREHLVAVLMRGAVPAVHPWREFALGGGLMSYGPSITEAYYQAGAYAARILRGEKPADLPIVRPTKFELVINLKTARVLGLTVPPTLLARADEVIE